ncbi:hypothetical protein BSKO_09593 [Bryopsis sp. KO-2023]|nr:hypothetical protein BSKO_09593 [Bryopsis sp. KO-2023]
MSLWVKQHDPNHMVAVGEEGFYSSSTWKHWVNPDAFFVDGIPWARNSGQDSLTDNGAPTIDYIGVQSWPDRWGLPGLWFQKIWLREHINDAWWLRKPLVVEDFGKLVFRDNAALRRSRRDPFFEAMYRKFEESRKFKGPLKGLIFSNLDASSSSPRSPTSVRLSDSTWTKIIKPQTEKLISDAEKEGLVSGCVPGSSRSLDAVFLEGTNIYYMSNGPNLVATSDWGDIAAPLVGVSMDECIDACEWRGGSCRQIRYNPLLDGGTCVLRANGERKFKWSPEGWQTFFRMVGSNKCKDKKCKLCDQSFFPRCLKCKTGRLVLGDDHLPKCE